MCIKYSHIIYIFQCVPWFIFPFFRSSHTSFHRILYFSLFHLAKSLLFCKIEMKKKKNWKKKLKSTNAKFIHFVPGSNSIQFLAIQWKTRLTAVALNILLLCLKVLLKTKRMNTLKDEMMFMYLNEKKKKETKKKQNETTPESA